MCERETSHAAAPTQRAEEAAAEEVATAAHAGAAPNTAAPHYRRLHSLPTPRSPAGLADDELGHLHHRAAGAHEDTHPAVGAAAGALGHGEADAAGGAARHAPRKSGHVPPLTRPGEPHE